MDVVWILSIYGLLLTGQPLNEPLKHYDTREACVSAGISKLIEIDTLYSYQILKSQFTCEAKRVNKS